MLFITLYTKINWTCIKYLNVRPETVSFQDENIEEKCHEIGVDNNLCFGYDTKAQTKKTEVDHIYLKKKNPLYK